MMTCLRRVSNLLADDMYFARRQGVQIAIRLYHKWARPQVQFHHESHQRGLPPLPSATLTAEPAKQLKQAVVLLQQDQGGHPV